MPGLPVILMMNLIGWKVGGLTGALASAVATCGPSCTVAFVAFRLGHRFRDAPWQRIVRRGLVPVTVGIVIASGCVLARAVDNGWPAAAITGVAVGLMLGTGTKSTVDSGYRRRHRRARPNLTRTSAPYVDAARRASNAGDDRSCPRPYRAAVPRILRRLDRR
jgi:hypothetical protein